jgi:HEAT repeat protein
VKKAFTIADEVDAPPIKTDRIESWFHVLRTGTTRERLGIVREMVEKLSPAEAKAIVKIYPEEGDRVRWGLIRVLGELRIESAIPLILSDLRNSCHTECAIEALGKIGCEEAFNAIREYASEHPESAIIALIPLAKTGKQKAVKYLQRYLSNEMAVLRQTAVQALASIGTAEAMQILKEQLIVERDEKVRSSLSQAVHSLQAVLLPDITTIQKPDSLQNARNW